MPWQSDVVGKSGQYSRDQSRMSWDSGQTCDLAIGRNPAFWDLMHDLPDPLLTVFS